MLLVVADGPRSDRPGEAEKCTAARAIVEQVDWPCKVLRAYSDVNLGCRRRVSSGLDWVFDTVEEAIILEDDCVSHPSFFRFCSELLTRYREDERVMHIGGSNFQFGRRRGGASYHFSRYPHVWGWATWRRAWQHYDVDIGQWSQARDKGVYLDGFAHRAERAHWRKAWGRVSSGRIDTWDFQWTFTCMSQGGLAVVPNVNMVSNIGFGANATHTKYGGAVATLPVAGIEFPLRHPHVLERDVEADEHTSQLFFRGRSVVAVARWALSRAKGMIPGARSGNGDGT